MRAVVSKKRALFSLPLFLLGMGGLASIIPHPSVAAEANWDEIDERISHLPLDLEEEPVPALEDLLHAISMRDAVGSDASFRAVLEIFKRPRGLDVDKEFGIFTVDGNVENVFAVSTARAGKITPAFALPLKIERRRSADKGSVLPFPFHASRTYAGSTMYWGLQISGPYWVHSTPHYGELGVPASMGCIRMNYPTAMEIWDAVVNRVNGSAKIIVHESGSRNAAASLAEKGLTPALVLDRIQSDLEDAYAAAADHYRGTGHGRRGRSAVFPLCDGLDCFEQFGVRKK